MPVSRSPGRPLKIALLSYAYAPGVGGIETVSRLVADGLAARGHEVRVVTHTPAAQGEPAESRVVRRPTGDELRGVLRWADAIVQSNVSLALAWPLSLGLVRRPWVVVNHTPVTRPEGQRTWRDGLKLASLRRARVYAVSEYLRSVTLPGAGVMHNPYDDVAFRLPETASRASREGELLFLGRIVAAKGLDVLIEAMHLLAQSGLRPRLSIAGDGSERAALQTRATALGLDGQLRWLGIVRGQALGEVLRAHRIVVVPSRPQPPEALPLVPVEAIACGCVVIASRQGGLPESVGPCGLLVPPEDPPALAGAIRRLLEDDALQQSLRDRRDEHLRSFQPRTVIDRYEAALREAGAPLAPATASPQ